MSLKLNFSSLSLGASVDQQTGNLSVFDVVEEIRSARVPIQLQSLVISLAFEKLNPEEEVTGKVLIHILTPDGRQNSLGTSDLKIPAEQRRMKMVFRFGGFPLTEFGTHRFVLSWTDAEGAKTGEALFDFDVVEVGQPGQPAPPPPAGPKKPMTH